MEQRQQGCLFSRPAPHRRTDLDDPATNQRRDLRQFILVGLDSCGKLAM